MFYTVIKKRIKLHSLHETCMMPWLVLRPWRPLLHEKKSWPAGHRRTRLAHAARPVPFRLLATAGPWRPITRQTKLHLVSPRRPAWRALGRRQPASTATREVTAGRSARRSLGHAASHRLLRTETQAWMAGEMIAGRGRGTPAGRWQGLPPRHAAPRRHVHRLPAGSETIEHDEIAGRRQIDSVVYSTTRGADRVARQPSSNRRVDRRRSAPTRPVVYVHERTGWNLTPVAGHCPIRPSVLRGAPCRARRALLLRGDKSGGGGMIGTISALLARVSERTQQRL
jgi:hypothetical protein